jgi:hypothetical protein
MSIEQNLAALTAAVTELTAALRASAPTAGAVNVPQTTAPVASGSRMTATEVIQSQPQQFAAPAAQMPAPPTFAMPVSVPTSPAAPFADGQGLIAYVMEAYKSMGPTKGAGIQGVLTSIGVANINDVKPEQYGAVFNGVEALKRG